MNDDNKPKLVALNKRFYLSNYKYYYGGKKVKSCLEKITKRHEKIKLVFDPHFDL